MRNTIFAACSGVLMMGTLVLADPATLPGESTPAVPPATVEPATNPAATLPATVEPGKILILSFTASTGNMYPWIDQAIQQDLRAELTQKTRAQIAAPANEVALDEAAALGRGRAENAAEVVHGQYQVIGDQVRVTGEVLDVATGKPVGNLFATSRATNLFPLENMLAGQVLRALPSNWLTVALMSAPQNPQTQPSVVQPPASPDASSINAAPPSYYSYTYPDYTSPAPSSAYDYGAYPYYGYPDPYYWYSVPYYGPDLWFYGGFDYYHHHHGYNGFHDWYGHGYDHGVPHGFSHGATARPGGGGFHGSGGGGAHGGGGGHGR